MATIAVMEALEDDTPEERPDSGRKGIAHKANLGYCILLSAVEDYRGPSEWEHASAALFLYPSDDAHRKHLEWVCLLSGGLKVSWLRETLDKKRTQWDSERRLRAAARNQ